MVLYNGDTVTHNVSLDDYKKLFSDNANRPLAVGDTMVVREPKFPYIDIDVRDPAEIPMGR